MIRVSLSWISEQYAKIHDLQKLEQEDDNFKCLVIVLEATEALEQLFTMSVYVPHLRASLSVANQLKKDLDDLRGKLINFDEPLQSRERIPIATRAKTFLSVLGSELAVIPSFLVIQKEGYDVNLLTDQGHRLFPSEISRKVINTEKDMEEAGKALAFELPTACGFHVFRVLEAVLKSYWDHVSAGASRPTPETIGKFAFELQKEQYGEEKIWETLKQIAKLHRNPLIHPEIILSPEEAIEILGISRSAIGAMVRVMPDLPTASDNI